MSFRLGDTVVFDPNCINPTYWNAISDSDKEKYYGPLGWGREKPLLFTFVCEMFPQGGHCVLINMETGKVEVMRHTSDFRHAHEWEC